MANNNPTQIVRDLHEKKITVTRNFDAPTEDVWRAWTESELLDQWWAPQPWRAETKSMDFQEGGFWLYAMVGPDNARVYSRVDFGKIDFQKSYHAKDSFCDENGKPSPELPGMHWKNEFHGLSGGTKVIVEISFSSEADVEKIIAMGFQEGFTAALSNLDRYLEAQFMLRKEMKITRQSRVSTYLNFPGTTEAAFTFYKSIFGTQFGGKGIQRFGDIPAAADHPPVAETVKKMVLHVELPILGGHVLMASDAPKEMGFSVQQGNNMHICLEPTTKKETKKIFDTLSQGGNITMPLQDMFFGSYFGTCVDKFGINWMFNCIEK